MTFKINKKIKEKKRNTHNEKEKDYRSFERDRSNACARFDYSFSEKNARSPFSLFLVSIILSVIYAYTYHGDREIET